MSPTTAQYCTSCGAQLTSGAQFCANCGTAVPNISAASSTTASTSGPSTYPAPAEPTPPPTGPPTPSPTGSGAPASNSRLILILAAGLVFLLLIIAAVAVGMSRLSANSEPVSLPTGAPSKIAAINGMTQVTVKVTGCDDCTIRAVWAAFPSDQAPTEIWNSGPLLVAAGQVSFPVPVAKSQGLSFEVTSPRNNADAVPVAVIKYADVAVGTPVTPTQAAAETKAFGCWAGSNFAEETLDLQVDWYTGTDIEGNSASMLRAYFNPGLATYGIPSEAYNGGLGHQNIWSCS